MATKPTKVEVEIVATDEASPKIDRLEKKIDGLEADEARIVVTADITRLENQLAGSRRLMEQMEGDELTVQTRVTGRILEDLEAAQRLFNELDGKTGTVTITANARQLEEAARRANAEVDGIGRSANSSRSALANMIGNSSQDLGALAGIAGGAGVAIGQIGEYAADASLEGEGLRSVLRSFGAIAIPIAGLAGAMVVLSQGTKQANDRARELTESFEELTSATDEQVLATLTQTFLTAAIDGKNLNDIFEDLAETNLIGARRLRDVALAAGASNAQMEPLTRAIIEAELAARQADVSTEKYKGELVAIGEEAPAATDAIDGTTGALAAQDRELRGVNARWREYADLAQLIVGNVLEAARTIAAGGGTGSFAPRVGSTPLPGAANIPTGNVTIINPPGTPAVTAGQLEIFLSRNGER